MLEATTGLDGAYRDAYIDIAHFTQLGRERLTENLLRGLDPLLAEHPRLHCRDLGGSDAAALAREDAPLTSGSCEPEEPILP